VVEKLGGDVHRAHGALLPDFSVNRISFRGGNTARLSPSNVAASFFTSGF
jgi:hypothetical protein